MPAACIIDLIECHELVEKLLSTSTTGQCAGQNFHINYFLQARYPGGDRHLIQYSPYLQVNCHRRITMCVMFTCRN